MDKGPNVIRGYWNKPEATARAFTNGWLRTGDIARIDEEGFIYIVDRAKDMIIRGGENVYSVIVEAAIFEHPDVQTVPSSGVPHPTLGEEVAAVVVLRPGRVMEAEEIARHVADTFGQVRSADQVIFSRRPAAQSPRQSAEARAARLGARPTKLSVVTTGPRRPLTTRWAARSQPDLEVKAICSVGV